MRRRFLIALLVAELGCAAPVSAQTKPEVAKEIARESQLAQRFDAGRKWAVVVGVNEYLDPAIPKLKYCVADAKLVSTALAEKCGYEEKRVLTITDDQPQGHLRPLGINLRKQIALWLRNAQKDDTVLVYFSGHGFLDARGQAFLAPQDCEMASLGLTGFRLDDLRDTLQQCAARQKVLILDCCHAGGNKGSGEGATSELLADSFSKAKGLVTLASCAKEEKSLEYEAKKQGLFTWFLTQGLTGAADYDKDGIVNIDELYRYTSDEVPTLAQKEFNTAQTPKRIIGEDAAGVFALSRAARPTSAIGPSVNPLPPTPRRVPKAGEVIENSIGLKLVYIPPGEFEMGSPESEAERGPAEIQHPVKLTRGFYLGQYEVTQGEYARVMDKNPSEFSKTGKFSADIEAAMLDPARLPVENVSWNDAVEFCTRLSQLTAEKSAGRVYRLPTEAEWEYACRAGTKTAFHFGGTLDGSEANADGNYPYGVTARKGHLKRTATVGSYAPSTFGLYDMHGNVWEWCSDWFGDYTGSAVDPAGPASGTARTLRGGSWDVSCKLARSAVRNGQPPTRRDIYFGMRVALSGEAP